MSKGGAMAIQHQTGKAKPTVRRRQARFRAEGVDGPLHETTHPADKPPRTVGAVERVVAMTLPDPPGEATDLTGRAEDAILTTNPPQPAKCRIRRRVAQARQRRDAGR
jgi:hypothetical protein